MWTREKIIKALAITAALTMFFVFPLGVRAIDSDWSPFLWVIGSDLFMYGSTTDFGIFRNGTAFRRWQTRLIIFGFCLMFGGFCLSYMRLQWYTSLIDTIMRPKDYTELRLFIDVNVPLLGAAILWLATIQRTANRLFSKKRTDASFAS